MDRIIATEYTTGTVAGTRWLHTVLVGGSTVMVTVRPAGCGWAMEADAATQTLAARAIGVVAQTPKGRDERREQLLEEFAWAGAV